MSSATKVHVAPSARVLFTPRIDAALRQIALPTALMLLMYVILHALLLWRFPWFVDETFYGVLSQDVQGDRALRFYAQVIDHKGLINSWIGGVLVTLGISPITAVRLISIVSGVAAAAATGWIVGRWRSINDGLIAAGLVAFIPYMLVHDSIGVYDAYITAGSMIALALQLSIAKRARLDSALLLGIVWGLLLLSKPTGALAVALVPFSLLVFDWRAPRRHRRLVTWVAAISLALAIAIAMYSLTGLTPQKTPAPDNHRTLGDLFSDPFGTLGAIAPDAGRGFLGYLSVPGTLIAIWGVACVARARDRVGAVLFIWAAAAIVASLVLTDHGYARYGLQAVPPLCAFMVVGGRHLWASARRRFSARAVAAVAAVLSLQAVVLDAQVVARPTTAPYPGLDHDQYVGLVSNRQPVHEAAELILRRAPAHFELATPAPESSVADVGGWSWATVLSLNGTKWSGRPRFRYLDETSPHDAVNQARFVIVEGRAPDWLNITGAKLVRRWINPRSSFTTVLYDRGLCADRTVPCRTE